MRESDDIRYMANKSQETHLSFLLTFWFYIQPSSGKKRNVGKNSICLSFVSSLPRKSKIETNCAAVIEIDIIKIYLELAELYQQSFCFENCQ